MWSEDVASRGGQEVASCLIKHLTTHIPNESKSVILYSDRCGGQNLNIKLTLMLKRLLSSHPTLEKITQKYFVSGHSYNSCDRSFAVIEKAKRTKTEIYTPNHWMDLVEDAKKKCPKYVVTKMEKNDFFSSKNLEQLIVNRKKDDEGSKISWFDFRTIKYLKENTFTLFVNNTTRIDISKKLVDEQSFTECEMELLYPDGRYIDEKKYKDLMDLLKYIPKEHHKFFQNLKRSPTEIDFGLASDSDDE